MFKALLSKYLRRGPQPLLTWAVEVPGVLESFPAGFSIHIVDAYKHDSILTLSLYGEKLKSTYTGDLDYLKAAAEERAGLLLKLGLFP